MESGWVLDYPSYGNHILGSSSALELVILAPGQQNLGIQTEGTLAPSVHSVGLEGQSIQLSSPEPRTHVCPPETCDYISPSFTKDIVNLG